MIYHYSSTDGIHVLESVNAQEDTASAGQFGLSRHNNVLHTENPFQIVILSYDPSLRVPCQIIVIAPEHYSYVEMDAETFAQQTKSAGLHQHNTFELVYVLSGTLYQSIESERHVYPAKSCLLLNRNVRHCEEYGTAFCTVTLSLSASYFKALLHDDEEQAFKANQLWNDSTDLKDFLSLELSDEENNSKNYIDFIPRTTQGSRSGEVERLFNKLTQTLIQPGPGDTFFFRGYICQLLNLLCQKDMYTTHPIAIGTQSESRIFSQITQLLEETDGRISRELLVEKLRYSGSYLNRIVQTYTGMNITRHALYFTIKRAADMLSNTNKTITTIAGELGFTNRTYFYKAFQKHYGQTPREYRVQHRNF